MRAEPAYPPRMHRTPSGTWTASSGVGRGLYDMGCDSLVASAHEWFMEPKEVGALYVRAGRAPDIWPDTIGRTGEITVELDLQNALEFETLGRRDDAAIAAVRPIRSEEHTSELQSPVHIVCRLLLEKKNATSSTTPLGALSTFTNPSTAQPTDDPPIP